MMALSAVFSGILEGFGKRGASRRNPPNHFHTAEVTGSSPASPIGQAHNFQSFATNYSWVKPGEKSTRAKSWVNSAAVGGGLVAVLGYFGIGHFELFVLALLGFLCCGGAVAIAVVVILLANRRK